MQHIFQIGCNNFSVYKQKTRTTSAVEAYNGVLGRFAEKNGHFFKFVRFIRNEEFFKSRHFSMMCESGGALSQKRRKKSKAAKWKKTEEAWILLEEGDLTVSEFLSRMVFKGNGVCADMIPEENIFEEETLHEEESEDEYFDLPATANENDCAICKEKAANIVFIPCKHLKICSQCDIKLMADAVSKGSQNYNCPCCRVTVQETIQVYT